MRVGRVMGAMGRRHRRPSQHRRHVIAIGATLLALGVAGCGSDNSGATTAALDPKVVKPGTLTVCTSFPYPPFEFMKGGKPAGFDVDLAGKVAEQLQLRPVFVNADFSDIRSGQVLNEGRCDVAVAGITITGDRARVLDFSSPYFDAAQALVVKQKTDVTALEDLADARIGVQSGTTGEVYATDNAPKTAVIVPFTTAADVTDALRKDNITAGVYDNTVVGDIIARNPRFELAAQFETGEQYGMAVKKNGSVDLLRFINNVLAQLKENGGYDRLYTRWFGDVSTS